MNRIILGSLLFLFSAHSSFAQNNVTLRKNLKNYKLNLTSQDLIMVKIHNPNLAKNLSFYLTCGKGHFSNYVYTDSIPAMIDGDEREFSKSSANPKALPQMGNQLRAEQLPDLGLVPVETYEIERKECTYISAVIRDAFIEFDGEGDPRFPNGHTGVWAEIFLDDKELDEFSEKTNPNYSGNEGYIYSASINLEN